jgi:hypothetical protein
MSWLRVFSGLVTGIGIIGCLFFIVAYHIKSKGSWRKSEIGWFFIAFWATLGALFVVVFVTQIFGSDWSGRQAVALVLYVGLVVQTWWPARLLWRATKK